MYILEQLLSLSDIFPTSQLLILPFVLWDSTSFGSSSCGLSHHCVPATALDHEEANVDEFEVSFLRTKEKLASIENLSASSTVEDSLYLLFFIKKQEQSTNSVQWLVFS